MFTGIIEECGTLKKYEDTIDAVRLTIYGPIVTSDVHIGDSIAVNGVCLTVIEIDGADFTADVMLETLNRSSLRKLSIGQQVNLERAVQVNTRLGGHMVQGHVDSIAQISSVDHHDQWSIYSFILDKHFLRYIVQKGSVTIDGISLTVIFVNDQSFSVSLIPTTLKGTIIGEKSVGDIVNIEVDVIAKYIEKLGGFANV